MNYYSIELENKNDLESIYEKINTLNNSMSQSSSLEYETKDEKIELKKNKFLKKATFYLKKNNISFECPVCYSTILPTNYKELLCTHYLCNNCYDEWFKKCIENGKYITCPICRK